MGAAAALGLKIFWGTYRRMSGFTTMVQPRPEFGERLPRSFTIQRDSLLFHELGGDLLLDVFTEEILLMLILISEIITFCPSCGFPILIIRFHTPIIALPVLKFLVYTGGSSFRNEFVPKCSVITVRTHF